MRASMGGWVEKSAMKPGLSEMPDDWKAFGSSPGSSPPRRRSADTIGPRRAHEVRRARVRPELPLAREPRHDDRGEDAEHDLADDDGDVVAGAHAALGPEDRLVDEVADHAREEDDEGVHHALDERERDHVAVGHVRHLVARGPPRLPPSSSSGAARWRRRRARSRGRRPWRRRWARPRRPRPPACRCRPFPPGGARCPRATARPRSAACRSPARPWTTWPWAST